jgi:sugar phosphate isomerase/epimerase
MPHVPFALQLYTVRDMLDQDTPGTLEKVKRAGYDYVELAGLGKYSGIECKKVLEGAGLKPISVHFAMDEATGKVDETIGVLEELGINFLVVPWSEAKDKAGWLDIAGKLDSAGAKYHARGFQLCYHNHAHEFHKYEGKAALDILLGVCRPENVSLQLDVYWAKHGGADPAAYLTRYAGRVPFVHAKDMSSVEPHTFTECGQGTQNWRAIFEAGSRAGVKWYIVEQDTCPGDPIASIRVSAEFMAKQEFQIEHAETP